MHTADLAAAERLLREHGVRYRTNTIADRGIQQIFLQDPDGNHVELGTYPPMPPFIRLTESPATVNNAVRAVVPR